MQKNSEINDEQRLEQNISAFAEREFNNIKDKYLNEQI